MDGSTLCAFAFAFASRLRRQQVMGWFADCPELSERETHILATWSEDTMALAFDFGALVFINVPASTRAATLDAFWSGLKGEPHPPLREELLIEVDRGTCVEVGFDRVRVPVLTPVVIEVVATVLAQSVSIDHYDEVVQATLDRIHSLAAGIAQRGRPPGRQVEIVKFFGASIAWQVEIIRSLALLDKPDLTWDDALADELHDKLRTAFEIGERYRALEAKITTNRQAIAVFLDMMQHRRALLLEVMIVVLITVEIVLGLLKIH